MAELPTGTVTFLFTDIEGSTRLWEQYPEAMRRAVARHNALLHDAIVDHHGAVFKTVGDGFYAVFARASEAVTAACRIQQALLAEPWPTPTPVRVRIAVHTSETEQHEGDYLGPPLNRVARLLEAAHGSQVLLSLATEELVRDALPAGASLQDLGSHHLKELQQPERIFQLLHPDLPSRFPPLRSLDAMPNNLPRPATRFIGREREMAEVRELLASTALLTLTGAGGCGKTRLALQLAAAVLEQYPDGVWWVELAALSDAGLVPQTVAAVLGVREDPGRPLIATLTDYLRRRSVLLVLDNCEHLLAACAGLAETLLRACPGVRFLATSREGLNIPGETSYPVPPLSLPPAVDGHRLMVDGPGKPGPSGPSTINHQPSTLIQYEAVHLFIDRALAAVPSFALSPSNATAVVQVCRRLDGIPLAIELAAARVRALSVEKINERLDDRFRLLTGGSRAALPRQQTLRALIDWSYDLLSEDERTLLRRLAVFSAGWTLEAAEEVCSDRGAGIADGESSSAPLPSRDPQSAMRNEEVLDLLTALVGKSLVLYEEPGGEGRYRLLETVQQYGRERLREASEGEAIRDRHLDFFLRLAEEAEPHLTDHEQITWLDRLEAEHNNLRAALEWGYAAEPRRERGARLAAALWRFWFMRGYLREGRGWLEAARRAGDSVSAAARARAATGEGFLAFYQLDYAALAALIPQARALCLEAGATWDLALMSAGLGYLAQMRGDPEQAVTQFEESLRLARALGDRWLLAFCLQTYASASAFQGNTERALALYEESLALGRAHGDRWYFAITLTAFARLLLQRNEHARAASLTGEALSLSRQLGNPHTLARSLENVAAVSLAREQPERTARLLGAAEALREVIGCPHLVTERDFYERTVTTARAALGEAAFAAAWADGRTVPLQQAIADALAVVGALQDTGCPLSEG